MNIRIVDEYSIWSVMSHGPYLNRLQFSTKSDMGYFQFFVFRALWNIILSFWSSCLCVCRGGGGNIHAKKYMDENFAERILPVIFLWLLG